MAVSSGMISFLKKSGISLKNTGTNTARAINQATTFGKGKQKRI